MAVEHHQGRRGLEHGHTLQPRLRQDAGEPRAPQQREAGVGQQRHAAPESEGSEVHRAAHGSGLRRLWPAVLLAATLAAPARGALAWTRKEPQGDWTFVCETNGAPAGAVTNALHVFFTDCPRVAGLLGVAPTGAPRRLELLFSTNMPANVPAHTAGQRMTVAYGHADRNPDDLRGLMIHEWTHTVQAYPRPEPGWVTEGVADAVRLLLSDSDDPWRRRIESAPRDRTDYHHGYGEAARFLLWIRDEGHPDLLPELNRAMRDGAYGDAWWPAHTGRRLDEWWDRYRAPAGRAP